MGNDNVLMERVIETIENGMVNGFFKYHESAFINHAYPLLNGYSHRDIAVCVKKLCDNETYSLVGFGCMPNKGEIFYLMK